MGGDHFEKTNVPVLGSLAGGEILWRANQGSGGVGGPRGLLSGRIVESFHCFNSIDL